jgi:putative Holliday junction resolvase
MKYLGIDFGLKNIGLATASFDNKIAFPYLVLQNNKNLFNELTKIITKEKIVAVVVGESRDYAGRPNKIMSKINKFIDELKNITGLPIYLESEFMTSVQAKHLQGENKLHDASAATLILQAYLDRSV